MLAAFANPLASVPSPSLRFRTAARTPGNTANAATGSTAKHRGRQSNAATEAYRRQLVAPVNTWKREWVVPGGEGKAKRQGMLKVHKWVKTGDKAVFDTTDGAEIEIPDVEGDEGADEDEEEADGDVPDEMDDGEVDEGAVAAAGEGAGETAGEGVVSAAQAALAAQGGETTASTPLTAPITPLEGSSGMGEASEARPDAGGDVEMASPDRPSALPPQIALQTSTPTQGGGPARAPPGAADRQDAAEAAGSSSLAPASPLPDATDAPSPSKTWTRSKSPALAPPTPSRITRSRSRSPTPGADATASAIPANAIEASVLPAPSREAAQVGEVTTDETAGTMRFEVGESGPATGGEGESEALFEPEEGDGQGGEQLREEPGNEAEAMDVDAIGHER